MKDKSESSFMREGGEESVMQMDEAVEGGMEVGMEAGMDAGMEADEGKADQFDASIMQGDDDPPADEMND